MEPELKYICQVCQDGSISRAAEHLCITQPALSIAISKVEERLGMPLFDRSTRPLTLTQAGAVYVEAARQMMILEQERDQQLEDIRTLNAGTLCIGGTHYLNACILPAILTGFHRRYPKIRLELVEASAAELAQRLTQRELDLTLNCDPVFFRRFRHIPAFCDHILLAVPQEDPLNGDLTGAALTAADVLRGAHLEEDCPALDLATFRDLEFILLTEGNNLHDRSHQMFQEAGFSPRVLMEVAQLVTACQLAEHAMAATFISDRLVTEEYGHLCYYRLNSPLAQRLFYLLLPERKYTPFAVRAFVSYFSEVSPMP